MLNPKGSTAVYLIPGMVAKFKAFDSYISPKTNHFFPDHTGKYVELPLVNGFAVLYPEVGEIEIYPDEPAVYYTHKKFSVNKIFFLSRTGEQGVVDVISVPIHDHSSIVTGGPAYGTYFTDDETLGA
jgi:hypothetical protein